MAKRLLHYLLYIGRRHSAAEYGSYLWLIHQYQADVFGVVGRGEAYEGGYELAACDLPVLILLRGAGLSAHPVTGYGGVFTAALGYYAFQYLPHLGAGAFTYHPAHHGGLIFKYHPAVLVYYAVHDVRLHQLAAVYRRTYRCAELYGRYRNALAEAYAGKVVLSDVFFMGNYTRGLAADPASGRRTEPESVDVIVKGGLAHG